MPVEISTEAVQMLTAGALVAAGAVPVGLLARLVARSRPGPSLPTLQPWRVPWGGFEVFAAFTMLTAIIPMVLSRAPLPPLALGVLALPLQLGFLAVAVRALYPNWSPTRRDESCVPDDWAYLPPDPGRTTGHAGHLALAVGAWAILTPIVLVFHAIVLQLFELLELKTEDHPLAKYGAGQPSEQVLFVIQACVAAPLIEEVLFRGILLPWILGPRVRRDSPQLPAGARPWVVIGVSLFFAAVTGKPGPVIFACVLAVGLVVVWVAVRRGRRHTRAVYASAAVFAMVHSAVWPSPVPLFLLGLGLGWCAVRTRGVLAPAIVHGLFNAVSAVYVLRGGTG